MNEIELHNGIKGTASPVYFQRKSDHGVAYAVDEYVYDSACYMAIRIEADSHRRARIVTDDERVWKLIGENAATMKLVK